MSKSAEHRYREDAERAKREMNSVLQQAEKLVNPDTSTEPVDGDEIDIWGKRIGRSIGYLIATGLIYHLVTTYLMK